MNYALYQYINRDGVESFALVNTKSKDVMLADMAIYANELVWKPAANPEYVWLAIQKDKHHKVVAIATCPEYVQPIG